MEIMNAHIETRVQNGSVFIFPSAFTSTFSIQSEGKFEYSIFDSVGNELEKGFAKGDACLGEELNAGMYLVQVKNASTHKIARLVKRF